MDTSALLSDSLAAVERCENTSVLEQLRVDLLGKKGKISDALKSLGAAAPEERKALGASLNEVKEKVQAALEARKAALEESELEARLSAGTIDVTLPARLSAEGRIHPITQTIEEITAIFADLGFRVMHGPDIEDEDHNFSALNIPESHPARQMHDTFYLQGSKEGETGNGKWEMEGKETSSPIPDSRFPNPRHVLRTHTSPVQIRTMRAGKPPFRCLAPGSTYRSDSDQTHTPMFHQVEGFVIDKDIHMGHLKGTLISFLSAFFEMEHVPVRFRPSFFPFTEPSAEVDIGCRRGKDQLLIGQGEDWLEVMGCGMVHPNVLKNCGIDPNEWQGFAFGLGVERLAMLKYNIPDLRTFFASDARWLRHYGFSPLHVPNVSGGL